VFTLDTEKGEGVITVEVTTNKDGSRTIVQKVDGRVGKSETLSKDNTLSTKEYVESAYDNIVGEPEVFGMDEVMNFKMKEKLTTKQKEELGITEEVVEETPTTEVTEEVSKQEMEDMDRVISGDTDVQFRKKPKFRNLSLEKKVQSLEMR
jgi:hypothetical protein